jgi:1-acyl-sn-glycerol-3-phosphate acyltransferase
MGQDASSIDQKQATARLLNLVGTLARELHPGQIDTGGIGLDDSLHRDIGLDSLGRVELIGRIEREFQVSLPERVFADAESPRDLLDSILGADSRGLDIATHQISELGLEAVAATPESATTLTEMLDWYARSHPERPHIQFHQDDDNGDVITYGGLRQGALDVARGLQQHGLQPGDAVALMLPTSSDYFFSFFGVLYAGGVPVPIYPPMRPSQLEDHLRRQSGILGNCRAKMLITVPEAKTLARLLKSQLESLALVTTIADLKASQADFHAPPRHADDLAFIQYTSGSTGNPKGVMLTHANLLANIRADGKAICADSSDVFVSWLPLYHDMGLIGAWLGSLYFAPLLVIMSPLAFLTRPARWLWAIHRHRATLSAAPNFAYELCSQKIADEDLQGLDLGSWRVAFNGAETISPDSVEQFCERFGRHGFRRDAMFPVYGLAECSLGVSFPPLGRGPQIDVIARDPFLLDGKALAPSGPDDSTLRFVSCGFPLPHHEVRIVDAADRELPERQRGQLQFRGPSTTRGYFDNPDATHALLHGDWLDSGDLAYIAGGEIYITGRVKDLIIRAGRNIFPDELEGAVGELAGIRRGRVAAFASADQRTASERLIVLAETRERDETARRELTRQINVVATDLTGGPPDEVLLVPPDTVLKTSSGKIRRSACRELFETGELGKRKRAVWLQLLRLAAAGIRPGLRRLRVRSIELLYALYAWVLFVLTAATVFILVLLLPLPSWRWWSMHLAARLLSRAAGLRLTVKGLKHLPPEKQPCILISNHMSYIDSFVLIAALPHRFSFLAKAELQANPLLRLFLERIGTEFIERFDIERGIADTERAVQAARGGRTLMVYPEGTFTRMPGLLPFHMGGFIAAVDARRPIVPLAIHGTRSILRSDSWFPHRGDIEVTIGEAVESEFEGTERWTAALRLRDRAREFILASCGEPDLGYEKPEIFKRNASSSPTLSERSTE